LRHHVAAHSFFMPTADDELLNIVFSGGFVRANAAGDLTKSVKEDAMHFIGSFEVRLQLFGRPDCFKLLDKLGAGHKFDTERADQFDRARVHLRHVRHVVHGEYCIAMRGFLFAAVNTARNSACCSFQLLYS